MGVENDNLGMEQTGPLAEIQGKILDAIKARTAFEQKHLLFNAMRAEGVRRTNKPFPRAADFHMPLLDMAIAKAKPFWIGQAFNNDRLAVMVSKREQADYLSTAAAEYFDWLLRSETDFQDTMQNVVDLMLMRGRGILKSWMDPLRDNKLTFEAVDSIFLIMAPGATDFDDADWFCHVKHYTRGQYERDARFDKKFAPWDQICGGEKNLSQFWTDKATREGLTHTMQRDVAVIWEVWQQTGEGDWQVTVCSPNLTERPLRQPFLCPYKGTDGKPSLPFHSFPLEISALGWYAPRSLAEKLAPFEALACKIVNEWLDSLTFTSKAMFTAEGAVPNGAAIKFAHGEILPGNIRRVEMGSVSSELPQMVNFVQQTGEQVAQMPDFGVGQNETNDKRTATEINRIGAVMDVGTSFNGETFRRRLARVYAHCWSMILQNPPKDLGYLLGETAKQLPEAALHDAYSIRVGGRADQWNQQQVFQRAVARYQLLGADPNASHEELVKAVLTADDPAAAKTAFVPSNQRAATESEDEAQEISILRDGFPALVMPNEDHQARIHVLMAWLQKQHQQGAPIDPVAQQRIQEHLAVHYQYLKQQNPQQAAQVMQQAAQLEQQANAERGMRNAELGQVAGIAPGPQQLPETAPMAATTPAPTGAIL